MHQTLKNYCHHYNHQIHLRCLNHQTPIQALEQHLNRNLTSPDTYNLKDFPPKLLESYEIEAQHPDEFIAHLIDLAPTSVLEAAKLVRARLKTPPLSAQEYLEALTRQQLSQTVDFLLEGIGLI